MAATSSDEDSNNHRIPRIALAEMPDSRWVYMFLNGDEHFEPLRTLVNQRHYRSLESLLEKLTERIRPSFGAIRSIYTPRQGHRVSSIDDLHANERYVAAGYEKFRHLPHGYPDVDQLGRLHQARKRNAKAQNMPQNTKKSTGLPTLNKLNRFEAPITVYIHKNDSQREAPIRCVLVGRDRISMIRVLQVVGQRMKLDASYVRKLCFPEGNPVLDVEDLKHGGHYVALLPHESFKKPTSKIPNNYMRTYETLAQDTSGNASQSAIAEAEDENENSAIDPRGQSQEAAIAMKEASTSTTEDKETATTMSLYNNQELEDSAVQTGSLEEVRVEDNNQGAPHQDSLSESADPPTTQNEPPAEAANEESDNNEILNSRARSPEPNMSPPQQAGPESSAQPPREDVSASVVADTASPAIKETDDDDPSEIAYATPLQDAKRLKDLEQHLHRLSGNSNHKLKTSPDRTSKPEESDNISLASLNSFYEHEQQLLRAETEVSKESEKRSESRHSAKFEFNDTPKQQLSAADSTANKETPAAYAIDKCEESSVEQSAATETSGTRQPPTASTEDQFSSVQGNTSIERPRPAARRKSSGSINASGSALGNEQHAPPDYSPLAQRSIRVSESRASVSSTSSVTRRDSLNDGVSRRERRSSVHSIASLGQSPAEANGRPIGVSKQYSLDDAAKSRSSEKRSSKTSRTPSQDRTQGTVAEKSALKNSSGSISHSSRKTNDDGKSLTHSKTSRNGTEKKASGTKSKRPAEEDSNNKVLSRSSSVESLKSNKDSGYSPASERSKDSTDAPQRQKDVKDPSRAQDTGSSSKRSEEKLSSLYYANSPPHSPIRTYAYLIQEKPAASYDYRAPEGGPMNQTLYTAAPLRYSSATKNQWKPDTYPILEEDDVFYAKSSRGKNAEAYREIDFDEDNGGVFRARQFLSDTGGAVEIQESMDTKVDVPIDDMEALEVEEEYLPPEHIRIDRSASGGPGHRIVTFLPSAGSGRSSCGTSSDKRTMTRHINRDDVQRMVI
ncbi:uncharacterized protein LOC142579325 [Dermacentor variabilis]|uniref:uncharacterized protein LOC142579325 n=1 Tax=Dermacentor variabilis TaxID=34621 RepID=UPI003F5AFF57